MSFYTALTGLNAATAQRVLENLNPLSRKSLAVPGQVDAVVQGLATALRQRGHTVDLNVGQSKFRCDLAVRDATEGFYRLGLLVDTDAHYANPDLMERYLTQPGILRAFGWRAVFLGLGSITAAIALLILLIVPERPGVVAGDPLPVAAAPVAPVSPSSSANVSAPNSAAQVAASPLRGISYCNPQ